MKTAGRFGKLARETAEKLLVDFSDIKAVVVIGSVAKGDYADDSDVDIVCVLEGKLDRERRYQLMQRAQEGVQFVPFSTEELNKHFEDSTTMAHSIKKGIVLFDRNGFLQSNLKAPLGPPSRRWMKEWFVHWLEFYFMGLLDLERGREFHSKFCGEECHCFITDNLARAAVNFSILFLEAGG
jgi:predicted nucleotidyltransferase